MATHVLRLKAPDPAVQKTVATLESSAQRGAGIVKQVLTFARGVAGERSAIPCKGLVEDMAQIVRGIFPRNITCETRNEKGLRLIQGDHTQLDQVLLNPCVNARDAMPEGGKIILGAQNVTVDEHFARLQGTAKPGPHVQFFVTDTGTGIPPEIIEKISEPFFTTKDVGKGTGLGIVKSHEGFLDIESKPGVGMTSKVSIPAVPVAHDSSLVRKSDVLPRGDGQTILVVDDDSAIREIMKTTLDANGYRALVVGDGVEAIATFARQADLIPLVITEMAMPLPDGAATIRVLQRLDPAVKIIVCSGMVSTKLEAEAEALGVKAFLRKPFSAEQLLMRLHEMLRPV